MISLQEKVNKILFYNAFIAFIFCISFFIIYIIQIIKTNIKIKHLLNLTKNIFFINLGEFISWRCWILHNWSKWSRPKKNGFNLYQNKICKKCGKIKQRRLEFDSHD